MTDSRSGLAPMQVELIAYTKPTYLIDTYMEADPDSYGMDHLCEFAGRACYQSFGKPNEHTRKNMDYIANILRQNHTSVLEHASATFYLTGVSRSLLAELSRHRHLSFSVQSQRFVDESEANFVAPPAARELNGGLEDLEVFMQTAAVVYDRFVERYTAMGLPRKQAREAARAVMPNMTETRIVVTGNLRAWRHVIDVRTAPGADAEIREVAMEIYRQLLRVAPASMQGLEPEAV